MHITVSKKIRIDAAHFLPGYKGPCSRVHGHSWYVEIGIKGPVNTNGMVMDFKDLGGFLKTLHTKLDHTLLNDTIKNPTAENIIGYVGARAAEYFSSSEPLEFIKIWESPDSCAEWRKSQVCSDRDIFGPVKEK